MCGTWERQRLLSPSTGACHSTPPARCVGTAAGRDVQAIRCGTFLYRGWNRTREIQKPLVFGGVLFHISFAVERNMAAGGIHAGRGCSPQSENAQRAVGDAGPYAVRHCRAEHGSGSGSCRRVPEPVIARHPRGTRERQRGETYKRFDAEPFCTVVGIGQGKSKNRWFLAAFFSIFLSLLKEIWPPEAYMQDAGAARNQRTRNGPSGTPAPTEG